MTKEAKVEINHFIDTDTFEPHMTIKLTQDGEDSHMTVPTLQFMDALKAAKGNPSQ